MRINRDGTIHLEAGEPIPVFCRCGKLYQPKLGSEYSRCPRCKRENVHGCQAGWSLQVRDES